MVIGGFFGSTVVVGLDRLLPGVALVAVLLTGTAALLGAAATLEVRGRARARSDPDTVRPNTIPVDSAFVCAECAEYTPPPDWQALLRASPSAAAPADADSVLGGPVALASRLGHGWPAPPESWGFSSPRSLASEPEPEAPEPAAETFHASPVPGPGLIREYLAAEGEGALALFGPVANEGTATGSALERWIASESDGLVSQLRAESTRSVASARSGLPVRKGVPCLACRQRLADDDPRLDCSSCYRPLCAACTPRGVAHGGQTWCRPCAANRVGTQLLEYLEPAADARPSVGVGYPDAGVPATNGSPEPVL